MNISVSMVDDDQPASAILAGWVGEAGSFECRGVHHTAAAALKLLPGENPSVVLMDINLPDLTGIECVRRLKPQMPATQFVMLTVYEDADHIFKALTAGASGYLLKRTPRAGLLAAIKDVYAGGSPMNSNIARKIVQSFQSLNPAADETQQLSPREQEVLQFLARGYLYKEIADALHISVPTVNTHIRRIYEKLHVRSRFEALAKFPLLRAGKN